VDTRAIVVVLVVILAVVLVALVLTRRRSEGSGRIGGPSGRLSKTSTALGASLRSAWGSGLSEASWIEIEEALLAADVGVTVSAAVVEAVKRSSPASVDEARAELSRQLRSVLGNEDRELKVAGKPAVILIVGVNGTGKTTTIAKLARRMIAEGRSVILAAADTYRAAAGAQLEIWGERLGVPVVTGQEGGDPAAVVFDALGKARAREIDVVIVDTAGRLHANKNLMAELTKVHRVASSDRGGVDEVLLVLDGTAGQNGLAQVGEFSRAVPLTGIVLAKIDGTAKGGIVIAVERDLEVPVKFIGIGESLDDLEPFHPDRFIAEMLEQS
jgi:fused signal recognition particle receptor